MQGPPEIERRRPRARLTNRNRANINEYGLRIPSKNSKTYEPNLNAHAMLVNTRTGYNYTKKATVNAKNAWNNYTRKRNEAKAKNNAAKARNNAAKAKNNGSSKKIEF